MVNELREGAALDASSVANELRPVLLKLNRELRRELHELGVTGGQVALLYQISKRPRVGLAELAAAERMSPAAMSGYVRRLERAGLARAARTGADRRRIEVEVTDEGARLLRAARSRRTAWLAARLRRLSDSELAQIHAAVPALERLLLEEPE